MKDLKAIFSKKNRKSNKEKDSKTPPDGNNNKSGGNGNGDNIRIGDCFVHNESKKIYQITGFENGIVVDPDNPENKHSVPIIVYTGKNMVLYKLNIFAFLRRFTKTFTPIHKRSEMISLENETETPVSESDTSIDGETVPLGELYSPSDRHDVKNMIIWPDALESVQDAILAIKKAKQLNEIWNLTSLGETGNKKVINLYGPSGTGKTMLAKCISRIVNQKLFQVDYAQIVDKYVGETGKHISLAFKTAKEKNAVLFFDEADSLCSKRVDMNVNADYANSVNQNRNVLMQELDKFEGIVVMSTNFFNNFDEALLRRIQTHIEMKLPDAKMREQLFKLHIPSLDRAKNIDFTSLALESKGFSGGDIRNVCINGMQAASKPEDVNEWVLKNEILQKQIQKIRDAKDSHKKSGSDMPTKAPIGFGSSKLIELN